MLNLWKNPRSEILWFRRRVPKRLVAFMGRREVKFSLGTADPVEAKLRCRAEGLKLDKLWHERLNGHTYTVLSQRQISALAGEFYREMIAAHQDNPGTPHDWEVLLRRDAERMKRPTTLMPRDVHLRFAFRTEVEEFLDRQGYKLSGATMDGFVSAYLQAKAQAAEILRRNAGSNYKPDPEADRFPSPGILKNDGKVAAFEMFDAYAAEAGLADKTKRSWKSMLTVLTVFVGHDDLARLTARNMIDWKDHLLKPGPDGVKMHGKTVRNGYLGSVKALLNYAVQQQRLPGNVAQNVTVRLVKKKKQREKGFTHEEALQILTATFAPPPRALSAENAAARRWVPWICAYTGARVNEITQLLPSDLTTVNGYSVLRIDAEASKTSEYRNVPLHEHLIEEGFLEYVASRGKRPLFYDPSRSRGGRDGGLHFRKAGERLAEWIRGKDVGVTDRRVAPNHGWRHRFSSMARYVHMHVDVQNIIQGHSGDKVASDYGDAWIETAYFEIMKIPRYVVDASASKSVEVA